MTIQKTTALPASVLALGLFLWPYAVAHGQSPANPRPAAPDVPGTAPGTATPGTAKSGTPTPGTTTPGTTTPGTTTPGTTTPGTTTPGATKPAPTKPKPWAVGVTPAQRQRALALYKAGNRAFEEEKLSIARTKYSEAIKIWNHPSIGFNLAVVLFKLDEPLKSYDTLRDALRFGQGPLNHHLYRAAQNYLQLLRARMTELNITCDEAGAQVSLDGEVVFTGPGSYKKLILQGKQYHIVARKARYVTVTRSVTPPNGTRSLDLPIPMIPISATVRFQRRWKRWIPWSVFAAGLATAAIGIPLTLKAINDYKAYDDGVSRECSNDGCPAGTLSATVDNRLSSGNASKYSAIFLFALGGAALAAGIVLVVLNQRRRININEKDTEPSPGPANDTPKLRVGAGGFELSF